MEAADRRLMRLTLAAMWLVTGALSFGIYPQADSLSLLERVGLHGTTALTTLYLAAALDIALGLLTLFRSSKFLWKAQAMLIVAYTLIISLWLPEFWLHPFGPILKNLPVLMLLWLLNKYEGTQS
jgi:hypothetical protein